MKDKFITLVIATYNKATRIIFLLESLINQKCDIGFDIVIIDDGSTDNTVDIVKEYMNKLDNLRYFYIENSGRSHARNFGVSKVNTKYVIFCDDDMILSERFIETHYLLNEKNPNIIIHGKIWSLPYLRFFSNPENGIVYKELESIISKDSIFYKYLISKDCIKDLSVLEKQRKITHFEKKLSTMEDNSEFRFLLCTGGNFSCATEMINKVGGFDNELDERWGIEDLELGYRFSLNHMKFFYSDEAFNYHITHYRKSYLEELDYSINLFYNKHHDKIVFKIKDLLLGAGR